MAKITFTSLKSGLNKTLEVGQKTNLMNAIIQAGLPIGSSCGGEGICGKCFIKVLKGNKNLSNPNPIEARLLKREKLNPDTRISCQAKVLGNVAITTSYW